MHFSKSDAMCFFGGVKFEMNESYSFALPVRPHVNSSRNRRTDFFVGFDIDEFSNIWQHMPVLVEIGQETVHMTARIRFCVHAQPLSRRHTRLIFVEAKNISNNKNCKQK